MPRCFLKFLLPLWLWLGLSTAWAQTFVMHCDVEGTIPAMDDLKLKPAQVTLEIQAMGNNLFLKIKGPVPYELFVNTLTTEQYEGKNLTNAQRMGLQNRHLKNGDMREVRISRQGLELSGYSDIEYRRKKVRMSFEGICRTP
jgi:hypothetical protein